MSDLNEQLGREFEKWLSEAGEEWTTFAIWCGGYEAARRAPAAASIVQPVGDERAKFEAWWEARPGKQFFEPMDKSLAYETWTAHAALAAPVVQAEPVATVIKRGADRQWMSDLPDGTYSLYLAAPTTAAADAKALKAAIAWWKSKRPCGFSKADHVRNPTVNCATSAEMKMALAIAAIATSADEVKS